MPWRRFILAVASGTLVAIAVASILRTAGIINWAAAAAVWMLPEGTPGAVAIIAQDGMITLAIIVPGLVATALIATRGRRDSKTRCRKCGYILRGISEPRCPECGERV